MAQFNFPQFDRQTKLPPMDTVDALRQELVEEDDGPVNEFVLIFENGLA